VENVGRGLLFSLGSIVIAIVGYIILSGVIGIYGYITGIVAIAIPIASAWLYSKGAGAPVKAGRLPWIGITAAAIVIGAITSVLAGAYSAFSRVGGDGGFFAPAFWRTVTNLAGSADFLLPVVITLAAGAFGIFSALRAPRTGANPNRFFPQASPTDAAAPVIPPPASGVTPPPPAAPSPGVILNGKPVDDPDKS
jgi:hypothetical protein